MQKVSRTMLAVVAAIQSGAHTRRKPKYIKEQALVSNPYPTLDRELSLVSYPIIYSAEMEKVAVMLNLSESASVGAPFIYNGLMREPTAIIDGVKDISIASTPIISNGYIKSIKINLDAGSDVGGVITPKIAFGSMERIRIDAEAGGEQAGLSVPIIVSGLLNS